MFIYPNKISLVIFLPALVQDSGSSANGEKWEGVSREYQCSVVVLLASPNRLGMIAVVFAICSGFVLFSCERAVFSCHWLTRVPCSQICYASFILFNVCQHVHGLSFHACLIWSLWIYKHIYIYTYIYIYLHIDI